MRKALIFLLALVLAVSFIVPVHASSQLGMIAYQESTLEDGTIVITEVWEICGSRSSDKSFVQKKSLVRDGVTIGIIAITALFRYDGNSVYVISKAVTQTDTYEGWNYKQNSFTSSGGTVTLDAKLTKLLVLNIPFTMTLTCDKNGNISYS
jgi:hypothetical protein